jgi:hypothetical protein
VENVDDIDNVTDARQRVPVVGEGSGADHAATHRRDVEICVYDGTGPHLRQSILGRGLAGGSAEGATTPR